MIVDASDEMVDLFMKEDDPQCKFKIGDRIAKNVFHKGDVHLKGTEGIIVGNFYMEKENMGSYLVQFESDKSLTFTIDDKICLLDEFQKESIS